MGNDGGSIPKRRELVKEAARDPSSAQAKETQNEQQEYRWAHCALSQRTLTPPIVSDAVGNLYNKDAVLESLIANGGSDTRISKDEVGIASLRDVVEVKFQTEESEDEQPPSSASPRFICPVTNKLLGPAVKAVYLIPCGHAFSEGAIKEISGDVCLQCNEAYDAENIIKILPTSSADKEHLKNRISKLREQGLTHSLKKASGSGKKRKKNAAVEINEKPDQEVTNRLKPLLNDEAPKANGAIKNAGTASLTARVLAEEQDKAKRRKVTSNDNVKSLFSTSNGVPKQHADFMTRGFSIPAGAKR